MKKKKPIIIGLSLGAIIVLIGVLGFINKPENQDLDAPALSQNISEATELTASNLFHDFGEISMADGLVSYNFSLSNQKESPVTISKIYTSCMCTEANVQIDDQTIGPFGMQGHGYREDLNHTLEKLDEIDLTIVFDPAAHGPSGIGKVERMVIIETEQGDQLIHNFEATITP